jgi:probable rRNA maturation factor
MNLTCDILIDDPRWSDRLDPEALVNRAVAKTLDVTKAALNPHAEVSFSFSDDERIRELNSEWRKKDAPTNVLSFPASDGGDLEDALLLGDVILAYETIDREALDEGKDFAHHTAHMIVHGLLHLIGFDHESDAQAAEMENLESLILTDLGVPDPWADQIETREV